MADGFFLRPPKEHLGRESQAFEVCDIREARVWLKAVAGSKTEGGDCVPQASTFASAGTLVVVQMSQDHVPQLRSDGNPSLTPAAGCVVIGV